MSKKPRNSTLVELPVPNKEELGSDNAEQELTLTLLGSGENILDQVEAAIHRIEDGGYGRCEECGEEIPKSRLDAIPYAADCVRCASEQEEVLTTIEQPPT